MKGRNLTRKWRIGQALMILSLVFLAFGLFAIGWAVWPAPMDAVSMTIPEGVLPGAPAGEGHASLSEYVLNISWPRWQRLGEGYRNIKLFLDDPELDRVRPVQVVIAEANLVALPIEPTGGIQTNLGAGQDMTILWAVPGNQVGEFPGEVILSFGFFDDSSAEMIAVPVAVVDFEIKVISLFGLEHRLVLWLAFVSLVLWGALFVSGRGLQAFMDRMVGK
jgi:hypothetical protein